MGETEILKALTLLWNESTIVYKRYLAGGRKFGEARQLMMVNKKAMALLKNSGQDLDKDLSDDVRLLLAHYEAWTEKWEALKQLAQPVDEDEFVFANEIVFPKAAASRLEERLAGNQKAFE